MAEPREKTQIRFTYGHYLLWPEHERWQVIDGVAYDMTPAPSRRHQEITVEMVVQLGNFLRDRPCRVYVAPFDVRLPDGDEPDEEVHTVVQPDISVVCDEKKLDERGCRGAPDFIIEILSPSTVHLDQEKKRELYERRGVREYWIVDPDGRTVAIHRLFADGKYGQAESVPAAGEMPVEVLPGCTFDMDRVMR